MKGFSEFPNRLNILYSHRTRGRDVEGVHIKGMADAFVQLGHKVAFIAVPGAQIACSGKENKQNGNSFSPWKFVSKYCPQFLFEVMELLYNFLLYVRLSQEFKNQQFDFVYERYALNTFATVLFGKRHKVPVILEVNDATGIQRVRHHKAEFIARRIESWVFRNCSAIVTISSEFQRILCQRIAEKEKITFVPNAVDPAIFDPALYDDHIRTELGEGKVVIGFIGSFAFWHGVELLIEVMPDVIREIPNAHFLLIGTGERLRDIKNMIESQKLVQNVTFTGKIAPAKIPLYLKAMDIGVIPDSNIYGSPMKLFEYMAMETVPVAPGLPPILDVIEDGVTGLLFKQRKADNLKEQLIFICRKNKLRKQISQKARAQILKMHLWHHNADHVLNVYGQIRQCSHNGKGVA